MVAPKVAISKEFLEAYSRLPKSTQKKVREFTEKFHRDPTQSGINFERIDTAVDDKVRSVRIDKAYRAIIIQPPRGDIYLCVWVDRHDDAYRWAKNKRFEVNPALGVFQLFEVVVAEPGPMYSVAAEAAPDYAADLATAPPALLAGVDDEDLLLAGVPGELLQAVRSLSSDDELDELAPQLPTDARDILYLLAAGYSLVEALEEAERSTVKPAAQIDLEDFAAALTQPEAQQSFRIMEDESQLREVLNAPLEQWRVFLHPMQQKLVRMQANGPVRVLGSAGTGKTVVLMHRARHLASKVFTDTNDRILVTTFTRNLALDLKAHLKKLCGDSFARLEVGNLHNWAMRFLRKHGMRTRIVTDTNRRNFFESAASDAGVEQYSLSFLMEEWDRVIQAQSVQSPDDYYTARRVGRGTRLSRRQRRDVWQVFEGYRRLLEEEGLKEYEDVLRETRLFIERQEVSLPYRAVLADEVQDLTPNGLLLLRALVPPGPHDMFLVGDGHQRIYGQKVRLGNCGIEIRGRSRRLKVNYRTTEQIRARAVALLEGCEIDDLDGGTDTLKGYFSIREGPAPALKHFAKDGQEAEYVVKKIQGWLADVPAESICVTARTHSLLEDRYQKMLEGSGITTALVEQEPESEMKKPGVRLATMHRMKGLEFERVLVAGVQEGTLPLDLGSDRLADEASREYHELQERCLLYVATTRARDELVITGFGNPCTFL